MNINFKKLSKEYGTPLYVYDFDRIEAKYKELKDSFANCKSLIAYAIKANSNAHLLKHLKILGSGADCVSYGEIKRALNAGIDKYKIIFSGVGKTDEEIKFSLNDDILYINVESSAELKRVEEIAKALDKISRVSIRVNPNIDAKTHSYISTGLSDDKFGVDENEAKKLYIYAKNSPYLEPIGIHFHIGSQLTDLEPIKESANKIAKLTKSLKALNIDIRFFDVGGGLGIKYSDESLIDTKSYAKELISITKELDITIICEPGRFLVGDSGYLITKVLYEKNSIAKRFVIVDAAMNDLIRPSLYNAYHKPTLISQNTQFSNTDKRADIVGPICESGDFLAKNVDIPITKSGDIIVFDCAGAYGFVMSSNYNSRGRAAEVCVKDKKHIYSLEKERV